MSKRQLDPGGAASRPANKGGSQIRQKAQITRTEGMRRMKRF